MSVQVSVISYDEANKIAVVVAEQNGKKLFRSPMKCKQSNRDAIEKQIRKELKVYDTPLYGGLFIDFSCNI